MKLNAVLAVTSVFAASAAAAPAPVPQGKGQWIGGIYYDGHQPIPTYVDQNGHPVQVNKRSVFQPTGLPMKRSDDIDEINGQPYPNSGASMAAQVPRRDDLSNFMNSVTATKTINSEALEAEISDLKSLYERRSPATAPAVTAAVENNDAALQKRDWSSPAGFGKRSMTTKAVVQATPPVSHNAPIVVQYVTYDNGKRAVRDAMTTPAPPDSPPIKRYATRLDNGHWVDILTDTTRALAGPGPMSTWHPYLVGREADSADTQLAERSWLHPTGLPMKRELGDHAKTKGGYGFAERSWLHPTGLFMKRDEDDQLVERSWLHPTGIPMKRDEDDQLAERSWLDPTGIPMKRDAGDDQLADRSWLDPTGIPMKRDDQLAERSWLDPTGIPMKRDAGDDQLAERSWLDPTGIPMKRDDQLAERSWLYPTGIPMKRDAGDDQLAERSCLDPTGIPMKRDAGDDQLAERSWLHPTGLPTKRDLLEVEVDI